MINHIGKTLEGRHVDGPGYVITLASVEAARTNGLDRSPSAPMTTKDWTAHVDRVTRTGPRPARRWDGWMGHVDGELLPRGRERRVGVINDDGSHTDRLGGPARPKTVRPLTIFSKVHTRMALPARNWWLRGLSVTASPSWSASSITCLTR